MIQGILTSPGKKWRHLQLREGGENLMQGMMCPTLGLWMGILSLVFGVIVMVFPKILNYLIGIYFIIVGLMAITGYLR